MTLGTPRGFCLFDVARAIHAAETARLSEVAVRMGVPNSAESGDHLFVGCDDLANPANPTNAGSATGEWAAATWPSGIDEQGSVACAAWVLDGSVGDKSALAAMARAEAIVNDVLDWVRSLAVTNTGAPDEAWDMSLSSIDAWNQWLDDSGQNCVIRFSIDYRARI